MYADYPEGYDGSVYSDQSYQAVTCAERLVICKPLVRRVSSPEETRLPDPPPQPLRPRTHRPTW
ncbi:unnamed protein product, partial [Pylaiella littoralis]